MKVVILSGDPFATNRCQAISRYCQSVVLQQSSVQCTLFDLSILASQLGSATSLQALPDTALDACQQLIEAELLLIICPVVNQSFPGLFKHIFDLLDPTALRNKTAMLCTTGSGLYSVVSDRYIRPLFEHLGVFVLPIDCYIPYSDIASAPLPVGFTLQQPEHQQRLSFVIHQAISLAAA